MKAIEIPDGARGFDCNVALSGAQALAAVEHGYSFVVRYVRRAQRNAHDLTLDERDRILAAGLGLVVVQHVESESSWLPSLAKGQEYGAVAADEAASLNLPIGATIACDLEGVAVDTPSAAVIEYGKAWWGMVHGGGFQPCLYVGWRCGLTPSELYHALPFTRYWGALNLNTDEFPVVRGLAMKQHEERSGDRPSGVDFAIDTDTATADAKGGRLTMIVT